MQRTCCVCGRDFEAKRKDAKMCGATCRSNKRNGATLGNPIETPLVKATRAELEVAGKLDTRHGQQALVLAAQMSTGNSVGTLSKELDRVMAAATGITLSLNPTAGQGDDVDELRVRRNAKRAG